MIPDVDEVLRQLLIREIEIDGNEVDIMFDQPRREWSSRLSKPTINLFLFDLRENLRLRAAEQYTTINHPDGTAEVRRNPVRMDLRYLMTAWVKEAEDEHLLLSSAITGLLRHPFFPQDLLTERLQDQPAPIPMTVASFPPEEGPIDKFTEIWGVLDNEIRPGVLVTVTLSIDPYRPMVYKQVRAREVRFMQDTGIDQPDKPLAIRVSSKSYLGIAGVIKSAKHDPSTLTAVLVEMGLPVEIDEEGNYSLHDIAEGEYHLDILFNGKTLKRQTIKIPSPNYDIEV
jgi:hypothetical protein